MTNKMIDSGISTKHAANWTMGMAMRELVQNWLDVKNEFSVGGTISYKDGIATIKDSGPGMEVKHFSFGMNDKMVESIGQFGEGLKSAFLTLARLDRMVEIRTNGLEIRPIIQTSKGFGTETLHYEISNMEARHTARLVGTKINVECSKEELNEGKSYFVELISKSKGDFKWLDKNNISLPGGRVYIKGSAIGTIEGAMFSYHLKGTDAAEAVNRDRSSLDMDTVEPMIARLIGSTSSTKVMEMFLRDLLGNQRTWENRLVSHMRMFRSKPQVWKRVWNSIFGEMMILSGSFDNEAEYRGYRIIQNVDWSTANFLMAIGVRNSTDVVRFRAKKPKFGKVGVRSLNKVEYDNYKWSVRMTKKYYADPGKIVICRNPGALIGQEEGSSFEGMYDPNKGIIYIKRTSLWNRKSALHIILHETVHKVSGEKDCTSEFEAALLDVAVGMIWKEEKVVKE